MVVDLGEKMKRISFKGIFTLDEHILILDTLKELKRGEWVVYKDDQGRVRIDGVLEC